MSSVAWAFALGGAASSWRWAIASFMVDGEGPSR
jgi:hypothetical protein